MTRNKDDNFQETVEAELEQVCVLHLDAMPYLMLFNVNYEIPVCLIGSWGLSSFTVELTLFYTFGTFAAHVLHKMTPKA